MENKVDQIIRYSLGVVIVVILMFMVFKNPGEITPIQSTCKEDSLKLVINQLEISLKNSEDDLDEKEKKFEDILFEYGYGLDRIRETHPDAYKEFHRIISFKERYSHEEERENNKRLKSNL